MYELTDQKQIDNLKNKFCNSLNPFQYKIAQALALNAQNNIEKVNFFIWIIKSKVTSLKQLEDRLKSSKTLDEDWNSLLKDIAIVFDSTVINETLINDVKKLLKTPTGNYYYIEINDKNGFKVSWGFKQPSSFFTWKKVVGTAALFAGLYFGYKYFTSPK